MLKHFLLDNEPKVTKLAEDYKLAKVTIVLFVCLFVCCLLFLCYKNISLDRIPEMREVSRGGLCLSEEQYHVPTSEQIQSALRG